MKFILKICLKGCFTVGMDSVFFKKQPPNREGLYWGLQQKKIRTQWIAWEIVRTKLQGMKKQAHNVKYYDIALQAVLVPFQYILEHLFLFLPVQISNSKWYYTAISRTLKFCGKTGKNLRDMINAAYIKQQQKRG